MMENRFETKPPSLNHMSLLMLMITGTIAVFTNLANINLTAIERLQAV